MENKISEQKIEKYLKLTENALKIVNKSIQKNMESQAKEIIDMVSNNLSDAKYFKEKKDFVNSFAAINYAHGWIDCGVRLEIFKTKNNKLFTVK